MILDLYIRIFTSSLIHHHQTLSTPVIDGVYIIASDAHTLVKAPIYMIDGVYPPMPDKYPKYSEIIPGHHRTQTLFYTDPVFIHNQALLLPSVKHYDKCSRCEGDGDLYTHNSHERTCDKCGGDGLADFLGDYIPIPDIEDGAKDKSFAFVVGPAYFNATYLQNIARVAHHLNEHMRWVRVEALSAAIIYVGEIMFLLMPLKQDMLQDYQGIFTKIEIPTHN